MAATLHVLRPQTPPLAGFLRVGHTGHRKLPDLQAAGRFPFRRVVFDATHLGEQIDLLRQLKADGCEIVLDPNFAEMATVGRFVGSTNEAKVRLERLRDALADLREKEKCDTRSRSVKSRGGAKAMSAVLGR